MKFKMASLFIPSMCLPSWNFLQRWLGKKVQDGRLTSSFVVVLCFWVACGVLVLSHFSDVLILVFDTNVLLFLLFFVMFLIYIYVINFVVFRGLEDFSRFKFVFVIWIVSNHSVRKYLEILLCHCLNTCLMWSYYMLIAKQIYWKLLKYKLYILCFFPTILNIFLSPVAN